MSRTLGKTSIDEAFRQGGFTFVRLTPCTGEDCRHAPLSEYDQAFRILQQTRRTSEECGFLVDFCQAYPEDYVAMSTSRGGVVQGLTKDLMPVREDLANDDESLHHRIIRNASGRGPRIPQRRIGFNSK